MKQLIQGTSSAVFAVTSCLQLQGTQQDELICQELMRRFRLYPQTPGKGKRIIKSVTLFEAEKFPQGVLNTPEMMVTINIIIQQNNTTR